MLAIKPISLRSDSELFYNELIFTLFVILFLFADTCVKYRSIPTIAAATKDADINSVRENLDTLKTIVTQIQILADRGVKIL